MSRPRLQKTENLEIVANQSGLSLGRLRELVRSSGMPHEPKAAMAWLNARPDPHESADGSTAQLRREKIRLTRAQAEKAEFLLEVERGKYMSTEEVQSNASMIGSTVKASLCALATELPPVMAGLNTAQSTPICKARIYAVLQQLSDLSATHWKAPQSKD